MKPSLNEIKKKTIFMVCIVAVLLARVRMDGRTG